MKKILPLLSSGVLLTSISFAVEGIVADTSIYPYFDPPKPFYGKNFWNNVSMHRYSKELREVAKEPMTQNGFAYLVNYPTKRSFFLNPPPDNIRLIVREIELYSNGKNVARSAAIKAEAPGAQIRYAERVIDGNDTRRGMSYSAPAQIKKSQPGSYTLTFAQPQTISSAVLKSGQERSEEDGTFIHIASCFSIQYKDASGKWQTIPGTAVSANSAPECKLDFAPVTAREFRVNITGQGSLLKRTPDFIKNSPSAKDRPFQISTLINRPPYNCFEESVLLDKDLVAYRKWRNDNPMFWGFYIGEWDNDILHIYNNRKNINAMVKKYACSPAVVQVMQKLADDMKTRDGFMKALKFYFDSVSDSCFKDPAKLNFIDCCLSLSHYAQEWGAKSYIMETCCNGYQRHQPQMYFVRGATRQYGNQWFWYIAPTLLTKGIYTDPDYIGKWSLNAGGGNGGFSPSMSNRDRYLAWLAGASGVFNEVWPFAYCQDKDKDGVWELSPHGEGMKEWWSYLTENPDRGVSYAPVAIGMQWDHGSSAINYSLPFYGFPMERGDLMNEAVMRTLVGYKFGLSDQDWGMSETPYGDIADVILPAPPSGPVKMDVLKNYRVMFLCGTFNPDEKLAVRLKEYVAQGGTLAINVRQLGEFLGSDFTGVKRSGRTMQVETPVLDASGKKAFELDKPYDFEKIELAGAKVLLTDSGRNVLVAIHRFGKGNVILTTPDHLVHRMETPWVNPLYGSWPRSMKFPFMDWLFSKFSDELLPVKVFGHIQYGVNILDDGLLVYLFNNEGVHKTSMTAQKLDESKRVNIRIDLKNLQVASVAEQRSGKKLNVASDNSVNVSVGPGDIAIVKINCGRLR